MSSADLHIIVVTYKVRELLQDCLASLRESRLPGLDVVVTVVDNDSGDGSAEMVEECFPEFSLIRSENLGYPYANNLGFARRNARYQLMLNPDTLLPPSALAETVRYMDEHPDVGALGPRLVLADGSLDLACRRGFPTPLNAFAKYSGLSRLFPRSRRLGSYNLTYLNPDETADVGSLVGAFMLLRGRPWSRSAGSTRPSSCMARTWTCASVWPRLAGASSTGRGSPSCITSAPLALSLPAQVASSSAPCASSTISTTPTASSRCGGRPSPLALA